MSTTDTPPEGEPLVRDIMTTPVDHRPAEHDA